jgi:hypothetical protein
MRWQNSNRFDENIEIFNDAGQIVATCKHSAGWYPVKMPTRAAQPNKSQL